MKTSKLIGALQVRLELFGDLDVVFGDIGDPDNTPVNSVSADPEDEIVVISSTPDIDPDDELQDIGGLKMDYAEYLRRMSMCDYCDAEGCALNPDGICMAPFLTGKPHNWDDEGCKDFVSKG